MFIRHTIIALFLSIFTILPIMASAEFLAICTNSKGVGHYLDKNPGIAFKPFENDGFSGLQLFLNFDTKGGKQRYRIGYDDGSGPMWITHPTYLISHNPANRTYLLFVDAGLESYTETYLFRLDGQNKFKEDAKVAEVVWTQSRNGGTPKVVMMRSNCLVR